MSDRELDLLDAGWEPVWSCPTLDGGSATELIQQVARSGYPGLAVPSDFHGAGAALLGVAAAQRDIAAMDPGVAVALNMHAFTIGLLREYWEQEQDVSWFLLEGVAETGALVASAFAEPGGLPNMLSASTLAAREGTGHSVTGVKFPCSLITTATLFCVNAQLEGSDEVVVLLIPAGSPGLTAEPGWPAVGMTSSDTGRLVLDHVEVDRRLVFYTAPEGQLDHLVIAGLVWFIVLLAATYHGALTTFLRQLGPTARTAGDVRADLGRAVRAATSLGLAAQGLAHGWERRTVRDAAALAGAQALRNQLADTCDVVVGVGRRVAGTRLYTADHPLARLGLDLMASHHHPPSERVCDLSLGGTVTGTPLTLDPDRPQGT
jgi:alkylation response protein AidB-like acyl-CoA dehydrogenase